jgi:hypothetical protein
MIGLCRTGHAQDKTAPAAIPALSAEETVSDRQEVISEMRLRRILGPDQSAYTAEETALLARVRQAQSMGAFSLLRAKLGTLRGYAAEARSASSGERDTWLTVEGYRKYIFLRSQDARDYFESHGVPTREVFRLRTEEYKDVFDGQGLLTPEGDALYGRIRSNQPAAWRLLDGRLGGNIRPKLVVAAPAAPAPSAPKSAAPAQARKAPPNSQDPEDAAAIKKRNALLTTGYVEISEDEERFLLRSTGYNESGIEEECSLQVVRGKKEVFYLMTPSDPLFALITRYRSGDTSGSLQGSPTFR